MSGKLTIQEIATVLVKKNGFEPEEAQRFASVMFEVIQERLEAEQAVKVKGLGTFKIVDVEARESVSVQTGERFVISGHAKVSFTPDAMMKELVNKPFSQFETVVLNDGVEFSDMKEDADIKEDTPSAEPEELQPVVAPEPQPVVAPEPVAELEPQLLAEPEPTEEPEPQPAEELESTEDAEPQSPIEEFVFDDDEGQPWGRWILTALGVLALMALSAWGGYYYGSRQQMAMAVPDTVFVRDTVTVAAIDSATVAEPQPVAGPQPVAEVQPEPKPVAEPQPEPKPAAKPQSAPKPAAEPVDPYAAKDDRVRLGAYRIVGLDHEVKVLAGQTFYSICRAHLGPDMQCYVEVYNGFPKNPKVKEGQVIKIPKLQLKKKRKQ